MDDRFWEIICEGVPFLVMLFVINVVFLVLLGISLLFVTPGSGTYYVTLISLVVVGITLTGTGLTIRRCKQWERGT